MQCRGAWFLSALALPFCPALRRTVAVSTQWLSWPATPLPAADGGVPAVAERAHHGRVGSRQDGDDQGGCSELHVLAIFCNRSMLNLKWRKVHCDSLRLLTPWRRS